MLSVIFIGANSNHNLKKAKLINQAPVVYMGFVLKKFTSIHDGLSQQLSRYVREVRIPEWMTSTKTTLILKDPVKGIIQVTTER